MRRWLAGIVLAGGLGATPSRAEPPAGEASVGWQRARLAVHEGGAGGWSVTDGYGRPLTAEQVAGRLGDDRTLDLARRTRRRQVTIGAVVSASGPVLMLVGLQRITVGDWSEVPFMQGAGYATVALGTAATAGGIALLADRRPRQPSTYYGQDQARRLVQAHNRRLLEAWGLPAQGAALPPRLEVHLVLGPAHLGVRGRF